MACDAEHLSEGGAGVVWIGLTCVDAVEDCDDGPGFGNWVPSSCLWFRPRLSWVWMPKSRSPTPEMRSSSVWLWSRLLRLQLRLLGLLAAGLALVAEAGHLCPAVTSTLEEGGLAECGGVVVGW